MVRKDTQLLSRISELRDAIRRKYRLFKQGVADMDQRLETEYKPLLKELRKPPVVKSATKKVKKEPDIKKEEEEEMDDMVEEEEEDMMETDGDEQVAAEKPVADLGDYLNKYKGWTARKYMRALLSHDQSVDTTYGPYFEGDTLYLGDKELDFEDETDRSVKLSGVKFKVTPGVLELIFKKSPDPLIYDQTDLKLYKDILKHTHAHKKNRSAAQNAAINRVQKSVKYNNVIKQLFPPKRRNTFSGRGARDLSSPQVTYWDDPNELCERLQLLVTSADTGNNGHRNEIISIVEELREAGLIKGGGNRRFRSLLKWV